MSIPPLSPVPHPLCLPDVWCRISCKFYQSADYNLGIGPPSNQPSRQKRWQGNAPQLHCLYLILNYARNGTRPRTATSLIRALSPDRNPARGGSAKKGLTMSGTPKLEVGHQQSAQVVGVATGNKYRSPIPCSRCFQRYRRGGISSRMAHLPRLIRTLTNRRYDGCLLTCFADRAA